MGFHKHCSRWGGVLYFVAGQCSGEILEQKTLPQPCLSPALALPQPCPSPLIDLPAQKAEVTKQVCPSRGGLLGPTVVRDKLWLDSGGPPMSPAFLLGSGSLHSLLWNIGASCPALCGLRVNTTSLSSGSLELRADENENWVLKDS